MKIDISVLTIEDREYASTWQSFLPYVDLNRRLSVIAQIHHDLATMVSEDGSNAFQTEAELRVACSVLIVKSDILNDVRTSAIIYRYLVSLGVDVESLSSVLTARYKSENFNSAKLPAYVVTSPLSQYRSVSEKFIGDGSIVGYGQGEEADLFIRMRRPPAVFLIGDFNSTVPDALRSEDYAMVFIGSRDPKDASFGVTTYIRRDQAELADIIADIDNVDLTDI